MLCTAFTVFRDAFKDAGITIHLRELIHTDITNFASSQFAEHLTTAELSSARTDCLALAPEIAVRANGVFLWAVLVMRSLINDAIGGDDGTTSKERLSECPNGLNEMYRNMLSKADSSPSVRRHSDLLIYLATRMGSDRYPSDNALAFSWLQDVD